MRILLDENLDWRLGRDLPGHQVESVPLLGWAGIQNGELLQKATESGFEILVTTRPLMESLRALLPGVKPSTVTFVPEA